MPNLIPMKYIIFSMCLISSIFICQKVTANETDNEVEIWTCRNQRNQVSIKITSIEKMPNYLGYNTEFNLQIHNYSSQPIQFALYQFELELMGEQGQNFPVMNSFSFPMNNEYFYREVPAFSSINFFLLANIYKQDKRFNLVLFNYGTDNWFNLSEKPEVLTARFKYVQYDSQEAYSSRNKPIHHSDRKIMERICTGEFRSNSVKIDLSAY
jgi:hypothetical protein